VSFIRTGFVSMQIRLIVLLLIIIATYSDISIDRNDFDAGFLITFRKKSKFTLQKAMTFGQKITIIIITIIKHHNSKHYIYFCHIVKYKGVIHVGLNRVKM
jgi:hypothetical protein